jgi:hypothetical protein
VVAGKKVVLDAGCEDFRRGLQEIGYEVWETDLWEFIKPRRRRQVLGAVHGLTEEACHGTEGRKQAIILSGNEALPQGGKPTCR